MTYAFLAHLAQTLGLLLFMGGFLAISAYALWPSNRKRFDDAARMPLSED
jgi:cytochrome c oxidase cbb3-type subunit 4